MSDSALAPSSAPANAPAARGGTPGAVPCSCKGVCSVLVRLGGGEDGDALSVRREPCFDCIGPDGACTIGHYSAADQAASLVALADAVATVAFAGLGLDAAATAVAFLSAVEAAEVLHQVRAARTNIATVEAVLEAAVVHKANDERLGSDFTLSDGSVVALKGGTDRKDWDTSRVVSHVVGKSFLAYPTVEDVLPARVGHNGEVLAVVNSNGEVVPLDSYLRGLAHHVARDVEAVLPSGKSAMRVTRLKQLGLSPGDYCEQSRGRRTVAFSSPG